MIKLLHTEIDVVPDRKPQRQPLPEGFIGMGTAVLRITNATERENAYTVRIECEHPFWQDAWFRLSGIPPTPGEAPPSSKPDQLGPKDQWIKVFVSNGASRDVLISFFVPRRPECRSSAYPFTAVIETQILDQAAAAKQKERITEIKGTMILRPFYEWTTEYQPENRRVGMIRRKGPFELIVKNKGNDWLYCDVKVGKSQELLAEVETIRIAVPPPEPGKDSFRSVPLRTVTKCRAIRGEPKVTALPITVARAEAPTVPPLPEEATMGVAGAGLGNPVIHSDTTETSSPEVPGALVYNPPIPATITGLVQSLAKNAMALSMLFIGLVVAYNLGVLLFYRLFRNITEFRPLVGNVKHGEMIPVAGNAVAGSKVLFYEHQPDKNRPSDYSGDPLAEAVVKPSADDPTKRGIVPTAAPELQDKSVILKLQRVSYLDLLTPLLPSRFAVSFPVKIGNPKVPTKAAEGIIADDSVSPGKSFVITGSGFGPQGKVMMGNKQLQASWTDTKIVAQIPADPGGATFVTLRIVNAEGKEIWKEQKEVVWEAPPPETTSGPGGDPGTGPGTGPGGGPGGGTATTGPTSSTTGPTSGTSGPTGRYVAITSIPGYRELVAGDFDGAASKLNAERDIRNPGAFAVRAIALAEQRQLREAADMLDSAETVLPTIRSKQAQYNDARVLIMVAKARIAEARQGQSDAIGQKYGEAGEFALGNKTLGYPGIAMVQYWVRARNFEQAKVVAQAVEDSGMLSAEEAAALTRIRGRIR